MSITLNELRAITDKLYAHLEARGLRQLEFEVDYYWDVERGQRIDPTQEPTSHSLGQLSEDIRELKRIGDGNAEPIGYALVWLSQVLREVGEQSVG